MAKQQLKLSVLLQNCCYKLFKASKFLDVFGLICPVLQTKICCKRFLFEISSRAKEFEKSKNVWEKDLFGSKLIQTNNKVKISFSDFFLRGRTQIGVFLSTFFARGGVSIFLAGNCKGSHFEFFAEKVARGNAVQIFPNFPAKSLNLILLIFN